MSQANLRRAVSNAYYALFHFLVAEALELFLGKAPAHDESRRVLSRAFGHGVMRDLCDKLITKEEQQRKQSKNKPKPARRVKPPVLEDRDVQLPVLGWRNIPLDLQHVADAFVQLQEERHRADYDLFSGFGHAEATDAIGKAESAIAYWQKVRGQEIGTLFLTLLLTKKSVEAR